MRNSRKLFADNSPISMLACRGIGNKWSKRQLSIIETRSKNTNAALKNGGTDMIKEPLMVSKICRQCVGNLQIL